MRLRREFHDLSEDAPKPNKVLGRAALAAVILLAPGGFVLGTTLAVRHWRKKRAETRDGDAS